ncbi:hypothetical protein P154DRAFT_582999 [Amniculicola lignicola CBS 123094]|uniref:PXA domain-containing protein n=1 Tax=Amniculicola lignicola CBS 123094 TaxID=1392246 RepID=A0A6A5W2A9_9PLEO|nr:hypothetical protein P154DRAFT_582999 [Amniculicola lignicola CBS 123094]
MRLLIILQTWLTLTTTWPQTSQEDMDAVENTYGPPHVAFLIPAKWKVERETFTKRSMYDMEPLYSSSFIFDSLDVLVGLILRDFVKGWYGNISKGPTFVNWVVRAVIQRN